VSVARMAERPGLHEVAKRGDSEELQRLLDTGSYDVNEGDDGWHSVRLGEKRVRKGERGRNSPYSFSSPLCGLCAIDNSWYELQFYVM
jgi:hypothetical protein